MSGKEANKRAVQVFFGEDAKARADSLSVHETGRKPEEITVEELNRRAADMKLPESDRKEYAQVAKTFKRAIEKFTEEHKEKLAAHHQKKAPAEIVIHDFDEPSDEVQNFIEKMVIDEDMDMSAAIAKVTDEVTTTRGMLEEQKSKVEQVKNMLKKMVRP